MKKESESNSKVKGLVNVNVHGEVYQPKVVSKMDEAPQRINEWRRWDDNLFVIGDVATFQPDPPTRSLLQAA